MARKLIFTERFTVGYENVDLPASVPPGQVLVRTTLSGISHGTEMAGFTGSSPFATRRFTEHRVFEPIGADAPPFFPYRYAGYDAVGIVKAVGEGVTSFRVGDRVWGQTPHQTEFMLPADPEQILPLGAAARDEDAIMLNLSSIALVATNDSEIKLGDAVAVIGGGIVGQLVAQMAGLSGARKVFLVEPTKERREFATKHFGAEGIDPAAGLPGIQIRDRNNGASPDAIIECSGHVAGLHSAVQASGVGGTVVAAGFYQGTAEALRLGEEFLHNRVTIKSSMGVWGCPSRFPFWNRARALRESLHLLESRKLNLDGFISARFPFDQAQQAYNAIRADPGKYMKIALEYPREK